MEQIQLNDYHQYVAIENSYGGNQTWFRDGTFSHGDIIHYGGCGLIAMADLLLYLTREDNDLRMTLPSLVTLNHLSHGTYRLFVESLYFGYLQPWSNPFFNPTTYRHDADFVLGIQGWQLKRALKKYVKKNKLRNVDVSFLPLKKYQKELTGTICQQLRLNRPVPLLIGPTKEMFPKIASFIGRKEAVPAFSKGDIVATLPQGLAQPDLEMASHWVMITRYLSDPVSKKEYLYVSSWGEGYVLDFTAFKKDHDRVSGLLIVQKKS